MASITHTQWITVKVNQVFGPAVAALLDRIGVSYNPTTPIPDHIVMAWLVMLLLLIMAWLSRRTFSAPGEPEKPPGAIQQFWELFYEAVTGLLKNMIGPKGPKFWPLIGTLGVFILTANLIGLAPFCASPTANLNVTLSLALVAFFFYHVMGVRELGIVKYAKHFAGPNPMLAPLMIPLEIISHVSRVLSLSLRLFGNIFGEDVVIIIIFSLVPLVAPVPMMAFAIFTSILQAFIFVMLVIMYLSAAVAEEH